MDHDRCGPGARWCARADAMFNTSGMHVLDVGHDEPRVVVAVQADTDRAGCDRCGSWPPRTAGAVVRDLSSQH